MFSIFPFKYYTTDTYGCNNSDCIHFCRVPMAKMVDTMTTKAVDWINSRHSDRNPMHMANEMAPRIPHIEK